MIAPRALVVEASAGPVESRPTPIKDRKAGNTAAPGELREIPLDEVKEEARLTKDVYQAHGAPERFSLIVPTNRKEAGSPEAIGAFLRALGGGQAGAAAPSSYRPAGASASIRLPDADQRQRRHVRELVDFTQKLLQRAPRVRQAFFWDRLDLSSHEAYEASLAAFRTYFWDEVTGRLPGFPEPGPTQSRLVHEADSHRIYEVKLPLDETLFAFGSLLVPKDLGPGERRPVVVCQHGLEDRSSDTYRTDPGHHYYHGYATRFAERGYIVYAPQNPYIGGDAFRRLQRMAHPFGLSLFSFILEQHARTLAWLKELPFVDSDRIAFYGLSYGGVTAMRVTSLLTDYCLSICSANFNEWVMKKAAFDWPGSYLYTNQYEMPDFNLGNTFNYAEMAALIAPRPFMVERGSQDSVGDEEWVSFEFAKVRRHYANLEIADRAKIAHHGGGHVIDGAETFPFIDQELWRDRA